MGHTVGQRLWRARKSFWDSLNSSHLCLTVNGVMFSYWETNWKITKKSKRNIIAWFGAHVCYNRPVNCDWKAEENNSVGDDKYRKLRLKHVITLTNRFHVVVFLLSNWSQMTWKCGKNKSGRQTDSRVCHWCSYHI